MRKCVVELLNEIQEERIPHYAKIIRMKREENPNLASWFAEKPIEYYEAMLECAYMQIEDLLHKHNKYNGFRHIKLEGDPDIRRYCFGRIK